jgi:hypothetical protein
VGSAGTQLQFADATRTLSGSSAGILLGNQSVSATPVELAAGTAPTPVESYILTTSPPTVVEGNNGTKTLTYVLELNKAPTSEVSVNYRTTDAGTAAAGDDFQVVAGMVTFAAGQTAATVSVTVFADTTVEADETVVLQLSGSKLVSPVTATGTIRNDDAAPVDPSSYTVSAGDIAAANAANTAIALNVGDTGNKTVTIQSDGASVTRGVIINGNANAAITSGAAADTITVTGNGNNTITAGAGNDNISVFGTGTNTINVGTGSDVVNGGTGNDTIVFAAGALGAGDVVTGGAGNDTVVISGDGNAIGPVDLNNDGDTTDAGEFVGATLVGVENLVLNGTSLSIDAVALQALIENGLKSISGSALTSELTIRNLNFLVDAPVLDLSSIRIEGGLEKITTTGTGTLILNTTQTSQIVDVAGTNLTKQVIVTGVQSVAQADALIASGVTAKFAVVDTAENIALASASVFAKAVSIEATTDATAAQAVKIASGIANSANTSIYASGAAVDVAIKVSVTDTASMLANNVSGLAIADKVTATTAATVDEANAIAGANTVVAGVPLFAASYAVVDTASTLVAAAAVTGGLTGRAALNGATSVTVSGNADVSQITAINTALTTATGGLAKVASGYNLADAASVLTNVDNAAVTAAARNITVNDNGSVVNAAVAVALEGLANTGTNTYKLNDTTLLLRNVGPDATAVATNATTGGVVATSGSGFVTVADLNALVAKYGGTAFSTTLVVKDSAAELVKLSSAALAELTAGAGNVTVTVDSDTTATVAELSALNAFFSGTKAGYAPVPNTVKVKDTVAELTAAVKVPTTLAALEASASVAVSDVATVAQISGLNAALGLANTGLNAVAIGFALSDTASKLAAAGAATIIDASAKVTVTGTATVDQIDTITDAFYANSGSYSAADLGVKIVYALKDTAAQIIAGDVSGGAATSLSDYIAGASGISLSNTVVTADQAIALRVSANYPKFNGVYSIEDNVANLETAYGSNANPNVAGRSALAGATSVTLVDSFTNLFTSGIPKDIQAIAGSVIASGSLGDLTSANAADKANVDGFRISGTVTLANVAEVNALSAIAPAKYVVAASNYAALTGTGTGVGTFVNKAASLDVSDAVTVAKANTLLSNVSGKIVYDVVDTAANIARASEAVLGNDRNGIAAIDTTGANATAVAAKKVVNVAQATILDALGVSDYTISDTAANISAADIDVLTGALGGVGEGIVVNDGAYTTLTVAQAVEVYGTNGNATGRYSLVDTATNLANASATLRGYALNVSATSVATAAQAQAIGSVEALGTVTYDVTDTVAALLTGGNAAGLNGARNVAVTTGTAAATLSQAKDLVAATNSGTLSYSIEDAGTTVAADLVSTTALVKATAIAALNGATTVVTTGTVNGAEATALAAQDKAIRYDVSATQADLTAATVSAGALNEARNISVTGTAAGATTAAFAASLYAASNTGTVTIAEVKGTSAELAALTRASTDVITAVTVTTVSSVAEAAKIRSLSASAEVYTLSDTAENLAAASTSVLSGADRIVGATVDIIATTAATAAQALKIFAAGNTDVRFALSDSFANLMANADVSGPVNAAAVITAASKVTVLGGPLTLAQATALGGVHASVPAKAVYSILDSDAAIAAAITANSVYVQNAVSVTGEARVELNVEVIGGTTYIAGTKAQLAALSPELKAAGVPKLVEATLADLTSDAAYYSALPSGTSLRVIDTFANLTSGNSVAATAVSVIVTDAMTTAQATTIRAFGAAEKVYDLSDTAALMSGNAAVMTGATNIVASGTATQTQVVNILAATNKGTTTIAAASMTAAQADALTYNLGEKITSLAVTGVATVAEATAVLADIKAGNVGSATYSLSDAGTAIGTSIAAAERNGATNITATGGVTTAEAQRILSASNVGTTTIAAVSGSPKDVAALVVGSNDTITTITVNGTTDTTRATVAQAVAIAALDVPTSTSVVYNFDIDDTAAAILAAPLNVLDSINGTVKVKGAVDVTTAAQVLAIDTADTTIAVSTLAVSDTIAALKAASVAVGAGATKVTVSEVAKVADITAIDTLFAVNAGTTGLVYDLNDTYAALGSNETVAAGSTKVTVSGTVTVGQAAVAYAWGSATYNIKASPTSIANASTSAHVLAAVSVLVDGTATVAEAGKLSEMTNLTSEGFAIRDTAAEVYAAYNAVNATGTKDLETLALAKSINISNAATVEQLVGTATADGISGILAAYTISDSAAAIGAALASPSKAALIEAATKVSSTTAAATVANIVAIQDIFGSKFVGYDDPATTTVEKLYFLSDTALNLSLADERVINGAASVTVSGTSSADTMNVAALSRSVVISSGAGSDIITGTAFGDRFDYTAPTSSNPTDGIDRITNLVLNGNAGDRIDVNIAGTAVYASATIAGAIAAADTEAELNALFNSATGSETTKFAGGGNTTALLITASDGTLLAIDVDGNGTFGSGDLLIDVTGLTNTSFSGFIM